MKRRTFSLRPKSSGAGLGRWFLGLCFVMFVAAGRLDAAPVYIVAPFFPCGPSTVDQVADAPDPRDEDLAADEAAHRPVAKDDSVAVHANTATNLYVTFNDESAEGEPVTLVARPIVVKPERGVASRLSGKTIHYRPATGYLGADQFQYEVTDAAGRTSRAWVFVSVTNNPPVAEDDFLQIQRDASVVIEVTANDSDPDGDELRLLKKPIATKPSFGRVKRISDTEIRYIPRFGFVGEDLFVYEISDGIGDAVRGTVRIEVTPGWSLDMPFASNPGEEPWNDILRRRARRLEDLAEAAFQ